MREMFFWKTFIFSSHKGLIEDLKGNAVVCCIDTSPYFSRSIFFIITGRVSVPLRPTELQSGKTDLRALEVKVLLFVPKFVS